jgi:endonuclease-3
MEELVTLPGVARKTANIVLFHAFGKNEGIAVDTHVKRVSFRLGLTDYKNPVKIEKDLMDLLPKKKWGYFSNLLIEHGRNICGARKPLCDKCMINKLCLFYSHKVKKGQIVNNERV